MWRAHLARLESSDYSRHLSDRKLHWSTASEKDNDYFEILRSGNSTNFTSIATVKGSGTTQTTRNYNFTDYSPLAGTNYYQLKQVDTDGQSSLSKIVAVRAIEETSSLKIIALAEEQAIQLTAFAEQNSTAQITINDLSGKRMITNRASLIKGYNTIKLPASLAKGIYVLTIQGSNLSQAAKFIF
ncbi:MAG: T9SS type A sorting domain-containing protein [Pedobacter sp.]|nr:MAG: T9SS type A sorting domain-containing protein [Pedobacter sp.]